MGQLRGAVIPVTPFEQNCTILWDEGTMQAVVVDPGGDVDRILAAIKQAGVSVERIWLTHGHLDHAGGADELRESLGNVPIEGPDQRDEFLLQGDVFTRDVISTWIWYKREKEVDAIRLRPHPYEFALYYDI